MLIAGIDVGNSTTEIAVARVEPGRDPAWLFVDRCPTTGTKGSADCVTGIAQLLARAERRLGVRPALGLLAELHPVRTDLLELGRLEERALGRTAIARPASETPSGAGVGAGRLTRLEDLSGAPADGEVIPVICGVDFEVAAARLRDAGQRGWRIAAAIVEGDDGVLIGNRFNRSLPIVDEVLDAARLPLGQRAAVEVAQAGESIAVLSDPLRVGLLLGLDQSEARVARTAARAVAGCRAAIVVRTAPPAPLSQPSDGSVTLVGADGAEWRLDEHASPPAPGMVVAMRGAAGDRDGLLDVVWRSLPSAPEDPGFARRLASRRAIAIALLQRGQSGDLIGAVSELCPGGARIVAHETDAAMLGAATTPGAARAPLIVDLGGGTVDLHRAGGAVSTAGRGAVSTAGGGAVNTAGGGDLVTRICGCLLGCEFAVAERAKRHRSARVETPFTLHHEDGSRSFLGAPAPPETLARLCALDGRRLVALISPLAPEVWRGLRQAAKRRVLGFNVRRAIDSVGGVPRGELVLLVGGCAVDREVLDVVAGELEERDLAVARGNVLGRYGPRAAVAVGLVLAFARGTCR